MPKKRYVQLGNIKRQLINRTTGLRPPLHFLEPKPTPLFLRFLQFIAPQYLSRVNKIDHFEITNSEVLIDALHKFYSGKARLLLAFRHPSTDDPPVLFKILACDIYKEAAQLGRPFKKRPTSYFMYDRGIPIWAGAYVVWVVQHMGAIPIMRGKVDRAGLTAARRTLATGNHPLAIAPEGGTNSKNRELGELESGVVQLAFWAQEDLKEKGQELPVIILPIGIVYGYNELPWDKLNTLLTELEAGFGVEPDANYELFDDPMIKSKLETITDPKLKHFYTRYVKIYDTMLNTFETHYRTNFKVALANPDQSPDVRIARLCDALLELAENRLAAPATKGHTRERCHKLEQAAWSKMFYNAPTKPFIRGLADWFARDAESAENHMRIAESLYSVKLSYLFEEPSFLRLTENCYLTWFVMARAMSLNISSYPKVGPRRAYITVGEPIVIGTHEVTVDRKERKAAASRAHQTLEQELSRLLKA